MSNTLKKILKAAAITAAWLVIWEVIHLAVGKAIIVPSPLDTLLKLIELAGTGAFWASIGVSLLRILIGYLAALIVGTALGLITAKVPFLDAFFSPIAKIIRATPVASFIILLFVFLAKDNIPAVTAFLMVFPVVWTNVYTGIHETDPKLLEMATLFNVPKSRRFSKIYIPQTMPHFMSAARTGMGLAWKAGIAAEVLTNPRFGIGTGLYNAKIYLESAELFAWTAVIIIISVVLEHLLVKLIGRLYR